MITREQANLLADLARTIRPAWDTRAIVSAIGEVAHKDPAEIAWALIRVAQNPEMRTPVSLTFEGDHWRAPTPTSKPNPYRRELSVTATTQASEESRRQAREVIAASLDIWKRRKQELETQSKESA